MGYDIVTLETQNHGQDWPLIVTAVPCPVCHALVGEMCVQGGEPGTLNAERPRIDWHAERKQNAAAAWYNRETNKTVAEHPPVETHPAPPIVEEEDMGSGPAAFAGDKSKTATGKKKSAPPPPPPPPSK